MLDWSTIKFRASSWGNLLAESKVKGEVIGKTCASELIKVYNQALYGRKKDIFTKQMDKGKRVEPESIKLYSLVEGRLYFKNDEQLENDYFTGHPDIFLGDNIQNAEEVDDIKSSWELDTFTNKLLDGIDKSYEAQLNVYYDLTGAKTGNLVYCLVSAPQSLVEDEKKRLLYNMDVISEYSPEYLEACAELEKNMIFEDIDYRERVIKIAVPRNDELIQKMKDKVPMLRQWLSDFHTKHMNQYPK